MLKALLVGAVVMASTTVAIAQSVLPVGSIVAYSGASAPSGWLLCNGEAIPAGSQFTQLRTLIGPKTPDLRGYFLRGLDATGNVDPDSKTKPRTLLSIEPDAVGPHTHTYSRAFHNVAGKSGADRPDLPGDIDNPQTAPNVSPGETRPKNMAVNFIIKATK